MTNTMAPSEIADWLEDFYENPNQNAALLIKAAATIRELEARVNNQSEIIKRQAISGANRAEALKIATEALEPFAGAAEELPDDARCAYSLWESTAAAMLAASDLRRAVQALARISEVV